MSNISKTLQSNLFAVSRIPETVLPPGARCVYMLLWSFADKEGKAYPSKKRMAALLGCSRQSIINRTKILEELSLVKGQPAKGSLGQYTVYWLVHSEVDPHVYRSPEDPDIKHILHPTDVANDTATKVLEEGGVKPALHPGVKPALHEISNPFIDLRDQDLDPITGGSKDLSCQVDLTPPGPVDLTPVKHNQNAVANFKLESLLSHYARIYEAKYGFLPTVHRFAREDLAQTLASLNKELGNHDDSLADLKNAMIEYLQDTDDPKVVRDCHPLILFCRNVNKYRARVRKNEVSELDQILKLDDDLEQFAHFLRSEEFEPVWKAYASHMNCTLNEVRTHISVDQERLVHSFVLAHKETNSAQQAMQLLILALEKFSWEKPGQSLEKGWFEKYGKPETQASLVKGQIRANVG